MSEKILWFDWLLSIMRKFKKFDEVLNFFVYNLNQVIFFTLEFITLILIYVGEFKN